MKLSELLYEGEYTSRYDPREIEITGIVSDTRGLTPGCLFVCLRGMRFDSHTLVKKIMEGGAAAIITEIGSLTAPSVDIPIFEVKSTRCTLAYLHSRASGDPQNGMHLIGITGTNGKSSTAFMLYHILKEAGIKAGLIGTIECLYDDKRYSLPEDKEAEGRLRSMTTPDPDILYPILKKMKEAGVSHVIMEVSSHALSLGKVAPLRFDLGLFTNLSGEHLDFHSDMESYFAAKATLFSQSALGILNRDDEAGLRLQELAPCRMLTCGIQKRNDYTADGISLLGSRGVSYTLAFPGARLRLRIPIAGSFTVYNSMLAVAAARELGISPLTAAEALSVQPTVKGRMERLSLGEFDKDFSLFIDYAHTEAALRSLLLSVRNFATPEERIVLLFGCGGDRDRSKRAKMGRVAEELADFSILTSDNSRSERPEDIIKEIRAGMSENAACKIIKNRREAIEYAILNAKPQDIILLCGKGHETYQIEKNGVRHFDEREIVQAALEKRKNGDTVLNENQAESSAAKEASY